MNTRGVFIQLQDLQNIARECLTQAAKPKKDPTQDKNYQEGKEPEQAIFLIENLRMTPYF